ncbi:MAG: BON domain-containing protein [Comamonas sp.]
MYRIPCVASPQSATRFRRRPALCADIEPPLLSAPPMWPACRARRAVFLVHRWTHSGLQDAQRPLIEVQARDPVRAVIGCSTPSASPCAAFLQMRGPDHGNTAWAHATTLFKSECAFTNREKTMFSKRTDASVKKDIEDEIQWDPAVRDDSLIAVTVKDGVATLTGFVKSYMDSYYAEKAAKRVTGVTGVANDIKVKLLSERTDPEIAEEAVVAIKRELPTAFEKIKVVVKEGRVTLEGECDWNYQKEWAERAIRSITGVKLISNLLNVKQKTTPADIKKKIEDALVRSARLDADKIQVDVAGSEVTLRGTVHSLAEKMDAQRSAWAAPGVTWVANKITVSH